MVDQSQMDAEEKPEEAESLAGAGAEQASGQPKRRRSKLFRICRGVVLAYLLLLALKPLHPADSLFYFPEQDDALGASQATTGARDVFIESGAGITLHGWFIPAHVHQPDQAPTVIHFHGNAYNIARHLELVSWLPVRGYNLLMFDYRGYGRSEGSPSRAGLREDGLSVLAWARSQPFIDAQNLIVLGQSLGGAVSMDVLAQAELDGIRALVLDATFPSYRRVGNAQVGGTWLTQPLAWALLSDGYDPEDGFAELNLPVLVLHGDADGLIPQRLGREIAAGIGGHARFIDVAGADHLDCLLDLDAREQVVRFIEEHAHQRSKD